MEVSLTWGVGVWGCSPLDASLPYEILVVKDGCSMGIQKALDSAILIWLGGFVKRLKNRPSCLTD
jgi:hypothetical protein